MKIRFMAIFSALLMASLACSAPFFSSETDGTELPSNILFQDDFSDPSSGWDQVNVEDGLTDYIDGAYRIYVNAINTDIWSNPGLDFTDTQIEVEATKVGGDDNNDFGVICRYQDLNNFYFLIISSDGYYGVGKVVDGDQQLIGDESMPPSEIIKQADATNIIRADCVGNKLSIHVNGVKLAEYEDTDFTSGDVGLLAGSFENPGTDIHFENFKVFKP
ncbi:MAG: hypothetical protein KAS38_19435 [Anaerolineales bacterium]|nr:hypothetical protein [Anaerolineales bacterium]